MNTQTQTKFVFNDGGRKEAGFKGKAGDCVCRAICIVTGLPYKEVYDRLAEGNATQRNTKRGSRHTGKRTASHGINTGRKWFKEYMEELGFKWIPTMKIGQGCKVHLRADELPKGRLVVVVSKHYTAMIDGVIHDTYNPQRGEEDNRNSYGHITPPRGERCVYGYYIYEN